MKGVRIGGTVIMKGSNVRRVAMIESVSVVATALTPGNVTKSVWVVVATALTPANVSKSVWVDVAKHTQG